MQLIRTPIVVSAVDRIRAIGQQLRALEQVWKRGLEHLAVGTEVTKPYEQVGTIYIAISTNAGAVAGVPHWLVERGDSDNTPILDHEFLRVLSAPTQQTIGSQIFFGTVAHLEGYGRAFWILRQIGRDRALQSDRPGRIEIAHPTGMTPRMSGGELAGWDYRAKTGTESLSVEEVVPFIYFHPDPDQPYQGLAPLTAARLNYSLQWKSARYQELFYIHGGMPPFYIQLPKEAGALAADEKSAIRRKLSETWMTLRGAWNPWILSKGAEVKTISVNQRDQAWAITQELTTVHILAVFGTPPAVCGFMEDANRANSVEQKRFFWTKTIPPKLQLIADVIDTHVLARFWPDMRWAWGWKQKLAEAIPEDVRDSIAAAKALWDMGVPASRAFLTVGLEVDIAGQPHLEVGFLPFNVTPAVDLLAGGNDTDQEDDDETDEAAAASVTRWPKHEAPRAKLWRKYESQMAGYARNFLGAYKRFLRWYADEITDRLESKGLQALEVLPRSGLQVLIDTSVPHEIKAEIREADDAIFPPKNVVRAQLEKQLGPATRQSIKGGWEGVLAELGLDGAIDWAAPQVQQIIARRTVSIAGAVGNLRKRLGESLAEGTAAGESISELTLRVEQMITAYSRGQARVVARNETAAGFSGGRFGSMRDSGVSRHQWLSARDPDVRDSHDQEDGNVVAIGAPFPATGLEYPHDPGGPPEETIQCRCVTLPEVEQ